ncbi:MAG TPA: NADH-quinone oxidoreductase subunit J [Verrucomicrobiae bacterium]|nr:NADH-quinone oxidoreductase subunit J [Verrucomicrobiae bacterium]
MSPDLFFISLVTLATAVAAMSLRNLVHCALCLVGTFLGLAALYLRLGAQFIGFAQVLVYVGAVAVLIVFAILLTRNSESAPGVRIASPSWLVGAGIAAVVLVALVTPVFSSPAIQRLTPVSKPAAPVREMGDLLMGRFVLPLEILAVLLTAAMIGAVIIAMNEKSRD